MIHHFNRSKSPLAYTFTESGTEGRTGFILTSVILSCGNFPLKVILHLGQLPVDRALSAFGVTSQDVSPPSIKLSAVLPAGFPLSIINTSVDRQWTFYKGHLNKTEQCLRISTRNFFISLLQILSFSFWKLETSAKKTQTGDSLLSS